jgi:hypothetical protein
MRRKQFRVRGPPAARLTEGLRRQGKRYSFLGGLRSFLGRALCETLTERGKMPNRNIKQFVFCW